MTFAPTMTFVQTVTLAQTDPGLHQWFISVQSFEKIPLAVKKLTFL